MPREQSLLRPLSARMSNIGVSSPGNHPPLNIMFRDDLTSLPSRVQSEDVQGSVCQVDMEQVQLQKVLFR